MRARPAPGQHVDLSDRRVRDSRHVGDRDASRCNADSRGRPRPRNRHPLASRKGQGGGFSLTRPPAEIAFIEILEAVDALPTGGRCAFGWGSCDVLSPCPLHGSWSRLDRHLRDWARSSNLAEVAAAAKADPRLQLLPDPS